MVTREINVFNVNLTVDYSQISVYAYAIRSSFMAYQITHYATCSRDIQTLFIFSESTSYRENYER